MVKRKKFYITTAIDYPSGKPHMGHCYEKVCADVLARWFRLSLSKDKVFFMTGLDEHGLKIQRKAEEHGMKPQEYVDMMAKHFLKLSEIYNISYDKFIRTTEKDHIEFAQKILQKVYDKGDIYKGVYEGLYCVDCETYYTESELDEGNCPVHKKPCEQMKEDSYFLKMSKYQKQVEDYIKKGYILPEYRKKHILSRMKEGVRDLCVSRSSFTWGVPLPFDNTQYAYVWFDALLNYASGVEGTEFWPADLHLIGHDILWHHSVIWLSILLAAEKELPKNVFVHGFINAEGGIKMSKSLGNVIDPIVLAEKFSSESIRYFLIREVPFGNDGSFSLKALVARHNNELANDLGNLLQRTTVMIKKYFDMKIPEKTEDELFEKLDFDKINDDMEKYNVHNALAEIWKFVNECNKYINDKKPWAIKDKNELKKVIYNLADALKNIAILLKPFLPESAEKVAKQLGIENFNELKLKDVKFGEVKQNQIPNPEILFKKIEFEEEKPKEEEEKMDFEEWSKFKLKIGKVVEAEKHPKADKLLVLQVDLGDEKRQLVAGISKYYDVKEMINKKIVVITNLKPAKIRGVESNGMLLAAEDSEGNVKLLTTDGEIKEGSIVD